MWMWYADKTEGGEGLLPLFGDTDSWVTWLQKKQKNRKKIHRTDDSQRSHESCLKESEVDKRSDTSWMQVCKENKGKTNGALADT